MSQFQQPPNQWQSPGYQSPQQPFSPMQFMAPPPEPPKKKKSKVGWIVLGVILALLFACIGTVVLSSHGSNNPATTTSTSTQAATTSTTGQQTTTWKTTHTFSGNGTKKTQTFTIGNDWKILYSCNGIIDGTAMDGILGVSVYSSDNQVVDGGAIDATCKSGSKLSTGETEEHQGGQVFLSIDGTGSWTITVQEPK